MGYQEHLRSESMNLELGAVLSSSPAVLQGVDAGAAHALGTLGIRTVSDLAGSATFGSAARVLSAVTGPPAGPGNGQLPADLFTTPPNGPVEKVPDQDVSTLRLVGGADDGGVAEALDVQTIRDLALWPPYLAARDVLGESRGTRPADGDGTPADLVPGSGQYPIERAYYSSFVLADLEDPAGVTRTPLEEAEPLDPLTTVSGPGFRRPVLGARLTFAQSWYAHGVALGQLLHSLALAPGESTRVAMIDWSRQQTGTQSDTTRQDEMLVGESTQKRAMSEVQNAVAAEAQHGFSSAHSTAQQTQGAGSLGFSLGPVTLGGSASNATNTTDADTATGSSGVRNLAAAMTQQVADSTHQAASSARNMYASVVRELSQAEHETISTRVVGNFNHMHALTMQYYEVVQVYRTSVRLHRFEPCLFVPMKPVDFLAPAGAGESPCDVLIRRYRSALQAVALDTQTRDLLAAAAAPPVVTVEIRPNLQWPADPAATGPEASDGSQGRRVTNADGNVVVVPAGATLEWVKASFPATWAGFRFAPGVRDPQQGDVATLNAESGPDQPFESHRNPPLPLPVEGLVAITLSTPHATTGFLTLGLAYRGTPLEISVPVLVLEHGGQYEEQVATLVRRDSRETLKSRLAEDALHYSQGVWRAMDSATIALLLAPYTYAGQPLAQVVDPTPIGVTGNLLIFRMPWEARDLQDLDPSRTGSAADPKWVDWVTRHADFDTTVEDVVPLPSGGVFAEAVLGRANSAEKLDITRFWNWQDSPIPLQAPDIAAIQSGSRAQEDTTAPSALAAPVVAFNNPPALPDPAGLSGTLAALSNGGLFRDMSGSDITQALGAAALAGAGQGATSAGQQAVANAAMAAQKEIAMAKIAASILTGGAADGGTASEKGAKINEARSLDERAGAAAGGKGATAAGSQEAKAADGVAGRVLGLLGGLAGSGTASADGTQTSKADATPVEDTTAGGTAEDGGAADGGAADAKAAAATTE